MVTNRSEYKQNPVNSPPGRDPLPEEAEFMKIENEKKVYTSINLAQFDQEAA